MYAQIGEMALRTCAQIRAFIGETQCSRGREWELSALLQWRYAEWGGCVRDLGPGLVVWQVA